MNQEFEKVDNFWQSWLRAARKHPVRVVIFLFLIIAGIVVTSFLMEKGRQLAAPDANPPDILGLPIASATATVEVFIKSDKDINTRHIDRGGYLAFGRGSTPLLVTAASESFEKQTGDGRVMFRGKFEMDSAHAAVGKPIGFLRKSEYAQISFLKLSANSDILGGKVVVVINGSFRFEFSIPPQKMDGDKILVRGVAKFVEAP